MKIEEFIKEFNATTNQTECVKAHIINRYVPYEKKIALCKNVVESTTHSNGKFVVNTPLRTVFFSLSLIMTYTDIEVDLGDKLMDSFDLLDSNDLIELFLTYIPAKEYKKMNTILQMEIDDIHENERNIFDFIDNKIVSLSIALETIENQLLNSGLLDGEHDENRTNRKDRQTNFKNTETV